MAPPRIAAAILRRSLLSSAVTFEEWYYGNADDAAAMLLDAISRIDPSSALGKAAASLRAYGAPETTVGMADGSYV